MRFLFVLTHTCSSQPPDGTSQSGCVYIYAAIIYIYSARRRECGVVCCQRGDFTPSLTPRHRFSNYLPSAPCFVAQQCGRARAFSLVSVTTTFVTCPFPRQTIIKSTPTRRNFKSLISPSSSWTGKACYFSNKRAGSFSF